MVVPGFMRNSTPPWLRRLRCFSLDPRVVRSSHLTTLCLKALETFTLVTPTLRIMSTQHTGDGPPGDDDYYDPVGEDIRPSSSSFNPNAAAWDLEKMALHRIVLIICPVSRWCNGYICFSLWYRDPG